MAAALRSCFFSPAFPGASSTRQPLTTTTRAAILPMGRLEHRRLTCLKTAHAPRPRLAAVVRAHAGQNGDSRAPRLHASSQLPAAGEYFTEEMSRVTGHYLDIISTDAGGFLYAEAADMSARVCLSANDALALASAVMDSAHLGLGLGLGLPNEISAETIYGAVRPYAAIFSRAAEDSYKRKVSRKTVVSFLGALRGLAAVSHILLEGALEGLARTLPREAVAEYGFNSDVESLQSQFEEQMDCLEDGIRGANDVETCRLVVPAIRDGVQLAGSFVKLMLHRRGRALDKARMITRGMM
ncbi:hypothetical protein BRADI_2g42275v3 [Brachypodium distachyon]|uniref:Uncharacterized protein n=1 Tax=Brachypodium distachyon TaxID=15368 RepID=A0A0Q3R4T4_BRADI|nr:hypothetical protein BRADI_2g42275v3 [Brachypodium distachyon]